MSDWNSFFFHYDNFSQDSAALPIARASGTVSDVVTVHGGSGTAVLLLSFLGQVVNPSGISPFGTYNITANGSSRPLFVFADGTLFGSIEVPFTFEVPFPLTFGWDASFTGAPDFERLGDAHLALAEPGVYATSPFSGQPSAPLAGVTFTRESGVGLGVPEPAALLLCGTALVLLGVARRLRR